MYLNKLEIERQRYGEQKGKYLGKAEFENEIGAISLNLTPELCDKLFDICADGIVEIAGEAANNLRMTVIDHQEKIESEI